MARYMETAAELRKEVQSLMEDNHLIPQKDEPLKQVVAQKIAHIINLAIRSCPRGVMGTVRKNIVQEAVRDYCRVSMTKETDERTGREYNKIHISPKG